MLQTISLTFILTAGLGVAPLMPGQGITTFGSDQPGHYQVTKDAAREFGFTIQAQRLLADASMDPDYYAWGEASAHGQTANDEQGNQSVTEAEAVEQFYAWLDDKLARVKQELAAGRPRNALYWLGYSMHAVEDLSPHQGITNAQHAWLSSSGQNPDERPEAVSQARIFARQYLWSVWDKLGDQDWNTLRQLTPSLLSDSEKDKLIGHGWDLSLGELLTYKAQGEHFKQQSSHTGIDWDTPKVLKGYFARHGQ